MPQDENKLDKKKQKKIIKDSDIESYIESDSYGIGLDRFKKDAEVLNKLNDKIRNLIIENNKKDKIGLNSMDRAFDMVKDSIGNNFSISYKTPYDINYKTHSGIRFIGDLQYQNPEEVKMIDLFEQNIRNSFIQMNEFRIVCKIVPELQKIIKNFTRDILNNNDTHKHFITEIFKSSINIKNSADISTINEEIIEKIVKRNDLERKIKRYIEEALMMGAKPVAVIPYSDIKELITDKLSQTKESLEDFYYRINSNSMYLPSLAEKLLNKKKSHYTVEGQDDDEISSMKIKESRNLYEYIIGNSIEELYSLESASYLQSLEMDVSEDKNKKQENDEIRKKFLETDSDIVKAKKREIHEEVAKIINTIDQNVEIVDPTSSALALAKKALKGGWKFKYLHEQDKYLNVNADFERRLDPKFSTIDNSEYENIDKNKEKIVHNKKKDKTSKEDDSLDDVLILDFDPENVIPIIVNGIHVDYYVIEDEAYDAGIGRNRKFSFTFMDVIKSLGVGDDDSLLGVGGVQNAASDGMGYHNIPTFGSQINISTLSSTMNQNMQSQDSLKRNEILRDIILRTISSKLENKDLIDNKIFRDCIMNLFRQGYILKKKVQFTNIPAGNMVYFAHNLSNNGLPASIYSDTLFYCYIYISSLISSLMIKLAKSSNKDMVKFEVANDQNFALAAHMVEHGMSTRQTHGFGTFDGIMNVLKNSVAHDRIIIPQVDGNSMFEYEQIQSMNDINIDDEFTEKILYKIIQQTSFPAAAMNKLSEEEYARSIATQQLAYVDDLIEKQEIFASQVTKLIKLCIRYTKFSDTVKKTIEENIDDIEFNFAIPSKLFVENNTELFNSIESYADMIVKIYFGSKADEDSYKEAVNLFRKKVIQTSATNIDWKDFENLYKEVMSQKSILDLETIKEQKIHEETQEKAVDTSGGDNFGSSDFGSGGDNFGDMGGGDDDMGGDFGMPGDETEQEDENIEF